jgi:hypothetical protein
LTDGFVTGCSIDSSGTASNNAFLGPTTNVTATVMTFASGLVNETTSAASITGVLSNVSGGVDNQEITIVINVASTRVTRQLGSSGSGFELAAGADCVATNAYATLRVKFISAAHYWQEISRSVQNA